MRLAALMLSEPEPLEDEASNSSTAAMLCRISWLVHCLPANFSIRYGAIGAFLIPEPKGPEKVAV
jgi:hypothetical protein